MSVTAITDEVEKALRANLYYLAVVSALTLPDICSSLESESGSTSSPQYRAWYERWLFPKYNDLTPEDVWSLRCGVIHQGRFGHPRMQYSRVLFTLPNPQNNYFHNNILNDALNLDASTFCRDMVAAVGQWHEAKQGDANVKANLPRLLRLYPTGLAPYMVGMPLIA